MSTCVSLVSPSTKFTPGSAAVVKASILTVTGPTPGFVWLTVKDADVALKTFWNWILASISASFRSTPSSTPPVASVKARLIVPVIPLMETTLPLLTAALIAVAGSAPSAVSRLENAVGSAALALGRAACSVPSARVFSRSLTRGRIACKELPKQARRERGVMISGREKFGAFIRQEREAKGLSLRDMAKKIKVSPTFLSKVETEDWKPGEEKLRKIAEVIGCDPDDLLARAGRIPSELSEIIKQSPHRHQMTALLRTTKGFTAEEMEKLVRQAHKIKEK